MNSTAVNSVKALFIAITILMTSFTMANPIKGKDGEKIKATSKFAYSIYPILNSNKIRVAYEKYGKGKVSVKIFDNKMNLLYNDIQKDLNYMKRNYDMSALGNGEYIVKIVAADYTTVHRLNVGKKEAMPFSGYLSPELTNNKLRIAYQHASKPVYVSVTNKDGKSIYSKTMKEQNFSSVFNLSTLKSGTYTVTMSSDGQTTTQEYTLK
ncbi:T9SS type A sorting domain-containing protein [Flammeovirgaceae bacterium SG7u.111]|nr:T9SS type A sorting domain-containing protein [Flammeovirgaceae bacterium SG7u.132]WPO37009.1 T9SS type A sorting domain-containing protein [Flammeovirgaceae bacterium SG7u.111]